MDDRKTREHIQAHADAVVRGDMDTVVADFSEELRPQVPELAKGLPQPVTAAKVLSLDIEDAESVATIRYGRQRRADAPHPLAGRHGTSPDRAHRARELNGRGPRGSAGMIAAQSDGIFKDGERPARLTRSRGGSLPQWTRSGSDRWNPQGVVGSATSSATTHTLSREHDAPTHACRGSEMCTEKSG